MATEKEHQAAVEALLTSLGAVPLALGAVPSTPPDWYTEVGVVRRYGGEQRMSGLRDGQLYRITARQVAKMLPNAQNLRAKSAGLEGAVLTIAGQTSTPIEFESADPIAEDDGYYSGLETWTYALI